MNALLKKLLVGAAVALALVVAVGFMLPRTAHVERSVVIEAAPAVVFTVLNGFRQFAQWSPWADYDPDMKTTFSGPSAGVGAHYAWSGNEQVGSGSQEIVESEPYRSIKVRLVFEGFPGDVITSYTLEPEGEGTRVTWAFDADYGNSILGRYFGLLSDGMLGPDYEKGLARLKGFVEGLPRTDFSGLQFELVEAKATPVVYITARAEPETYAIGVALGVAYSRLSGFVNANGLRQVAPPLATYHGVEQGLVQLVPAIPVDRIDVASVGNIRTGHSYAGRAVRAVYKGPYAGLMAAREQAQAYLAAAGFVEADARYEQYMSDPATTPEADLVTHLYYPVK